MRKLTPQDKISLHDVFHLYRKQYISEAQVRKIIANDYTYEQCVAEWNTNVVENMALHLSNESVLLMLATYYLPYVCSSLGINKYSTTAILKIIINTTTFEELLACPGMVTHKQMTSSLLDAWFEKIIDICNQLPNLPTYAKITFVRMASSKRASIDLLIKLSELHDYDIKASLRNNPNTPDSVKFMLEMEK